MFGNSLPVAQKRITAETCVHYLYFDDSDYVDLGFLLKCNPAIKTNNDKLKLLEALLDDRIDIIASDHAPHTLTEKNNKYLKALPACLPSSTSSRNAPALSQW